MLSRTLYIGISLCFVFIFAVCMVLADCDDFYHNNPCVDAEDDFPSGKRWLEPNDNTVDYWMNNDDMGLNMPDLVTDVDAAAEEWSQVNYAGIQVDFELNHRGSTTRRTWVVDGKSVIGWLNLGHQSNAPLAMVKRTHNQDNMGPRIIEADMALNYYHAWAVHDDLSPDHYCVLNIATHEFGHFVHMWDRYEHYCDPYKDSTMWGRGGIGEHSEEVLDTLDKHALHYIYHVMEWEPNP